jgi:NAD(P)-dependent dehydrogenase (short-subunit alcohol dehydrogenase family)
MTVYLVTGATGFLGGELVKRLLARDDATVYALVRSGSESRLASKSRHWPNRDRVEVINGDLTKNQLGMSAADVKKLRGKVDHVVHLAALYDITTDDAINDAINIDGTRRVVELANAVKAGCLHHVSSVAVSGGYEGTFTEDMFDEGQPLPSPYHRTKFEAEKIVRTEATVPWRVYRPAIVVGDSRTGEIDKVDGPYYMFPTLQRASRIPGAALGRIPAPDLGRTNIVPVDYVVDAMDHIMHEPDLDGRAFFLVDPEPDPVTKVWNTFARVVGAPRLVAAPIPTDPRVLGPAQAIARIIGRLPGVDLVREVAFDQLQFPVEALPHVSFTSSFDDSGTQAALEGTGIAAPRLKEYAGVLWKYWADHLDRDRARRKRPGGPLADRRVVITGASSGIGRAAALQVAAAGGVPLLVARRKHELEEVQSEIVRAGGRAAVYPCDLTDYEAVDAMVAAMLDEQDHVDMLVNNAGRSIRRAIKLSYNRFHDFERTMALNYFAPLRLILALVPHMSQRRFGHIVNISSIGVQTNPPRFSAYVASKSALDAFSRIAAIETFGDGVTFTTIHMPLVRTPMIGPTRLYDRFPTITPEQAGGMVIKALIERPKDVSKLMGTVGEVAYAVAPGLVDQVLHVAYRVFPESAAARADAEPGVSTEPTPAAQALMRLIPGVHW